MILQKIIGTNYRGDKMSETCKVDFIFNSKSVRAPIEFNKCQIEALKLTKEVYIEDSNRYFKLGSINFNSKTRNFEIMLKEYL